MISDPGTNEGASATVLLPIMAAIFGLYLVIGLAMPVLPLHVHQGLGFGPFMVGLVSGSQFAAAMISRLWAGQHVDSRGAKHALMSGLLISAIAGLIYVLSFYFVSQPAASVGLLLLGRAVLGAGESFVITGALSLGMALLGLQNTGKVMAWVGTALYAGFAIGAPAGTTLYAGYGFLAIALATTLIPLGGLPLLALVRPVANPRRTRATRVTKIARAVWVPGIGVALSGVGFGAISTFIVLLYAARGWTPAWLPFTALSIAFISGRLVFGHLPDRVGGAKVALVCILIEAVGQTLIWQAHSSLLALAGVTLTGLGYSLVYPGFGVEAIRRAPRESRGLAMGAYTAFLDLSLGVTGPALGLVAGWAGLNAVFLASTAVVVCAAVVALRLMFLPLRSEQAIDVTSIQSGAHSADIAAMETF
jgi:MFS family permease